MAIPRFGLAMRAEVDDMRRVPAGFQPTGYRAEEAGDIFYVLQRVLRENEVHAVIRQRNVVERGYSMV